MQAGFKVSAPAVRWLREEVGKLDTEQILDEGAELLLNKMLTRFNSEQDPDGKPWVKSKAAIREGRKTLYKTGRLYRSIRVLPGRGGERYIGSTGVPYAIKHQDGIGVIRRRFIGLDRKGKDLADVVDFIEMRIGQLLAQGE